MNQNETAKKKENELKEMVDKEWKEVLEKCKLRVAALGEEKTLKEWSEDKRRVVELEICEQTYLRNIDNIVPIQRPNWIDYFIGIAFVVASRSMDSNTHHGCVITNQNYQIIGTGYNSFVKDSFDEILPNTNEDKYIHMQHSEINAIINSRKLNEENLIAFITGKPCYKCIQALYQFGIRTVYAYDKPGWSKDSKEVHYWNLFIQTHNIEYYTVKPNLDFINNIHRFHQRII